MLKERPIDQWEVTELKDELQQRNLSITGLKDDLVKRLSEDIKGEGNNDGETPPAQQLKMVATPGSVDVFVYQASGEQNVDEGVPEVMKQGGDVVLVHTTEASKEPLIGTSESSERTLDAVTEVESSLDGMAATDENHCQSNGVGLESFSSGVITLNEVDPFSECHNGIINESPEDETNTEIAAVGVSSDVSGINIRLAQEAFIGTAEAGQKTLDAVTEVGSSLIDRAVEATNENHCDIDGVDLESASIGNITVKKIDSHSEGQGDTIEKNPEDNTSKKMAVDDVTSDITSINTKLGADDVDMKLLELEAVPTPLDAIALHADSSDANAVPTTYNEVDPFSECHNDTIYESPEDEMNTKMAAVGVSSDVSGTSIKLTQEAFIGTAEAGQKTSEAVTEVGPSLIDRAVEATNENHSNIDGVDLESASICNNTVKKIDPHSEGQGDTIEKNPEDSTSKKMAVDDVTSDITSISTKLGADDEEMTLLEQEAVPTPPAAIALHAENGDANADATAVAEPEECTGMEMTIDDISSDDIHANIHSDVNVDCKSEWEVVPIVDVDCNIGLRKVPQPPDAVTLHADVVAIAAAEPEDYTCKEIATVDVSSANNSDADVVATAAAKPKDYTCKEITTVVVSSDVVHANANLGVDLDCKSEQELVPIVDVECNIGHKEVQPPSDATALYTAIVATTERMIFKNSFSDNALINGKDYEDSKHTNEDCKLILCGPGDQVSEVKLNLASQTKCVSILHDNISTNEKTTVMGNLSSGNSDLELEAKQEIVNSFFTIPSVGDCLQECDGDEELHKNEATEESCFTSNMDLDTKQDSPDDNPPKKHLDRSLGDESMDGDLMENMHDVGVETMVTLEHVFKKVTPVYATIEGSSGHTKEAVAEEKPPNMTEKRKSEGHESIATEEKNKRWCQWDVDTVSIFDQKASKLTGAGAPKVIWSIKSAFGKFNSTVNGDSPKEQIVPPPIKPATTSLRIDGFVRPFTLKAAQELLAKTGSISCFWMDQIKTHCYVTYSSVEEAVATRNAIHNLQWPPNNGSCLVAEFADPQGVKLKLAPPLRSQVPINPCIATSPEVTTYQQSNASQTKPPRPPPTSRGLLPTPAPLGKLPPTSVPATSTESSPPKKLEPALKLDDLFKKTQAYPRIYYMPLSEEEVAKKKVGQPIRHNP